MVAVVVDDAGGDDVSGVEFVSIEDLFSSTGFFVEEGVRVDVEEGLEIEEVPEDTLDEVGGCACCEDDDVTDEDDADNDGD